MWSKFASIANKILGRIESAIAKPKINVFQTLWVNLRLLPFKQGRKLPIFIYGHISIQTLSGGARIEGYVNKGMIKIGANRDWFYSSKAKGLLTVPRGTEIIFRGPCFIGNGSVIRMSGKGKLVLGKNTMITSGVKVCCENSIIIGAHSRITFNSQIRDTNFHYFIDTLKNQIPPKNGKIWIGSACWIGNGASITKGAVIPDYTMTAAGSLMNKDYIAMNNGVDEPLFLAGTPAKIKGKGLKKIMFLAKEMEMDQFFRSHPDAKFMDGTGYDYNYQEL